MGEGPLKDDKSSYGGEDRKDPDGGHSSSYEERVPLTAYEIGLFIDEIEDLVCSGVSVPLTSKVFVDRQQALDALQVLRTNLPWEVMEARRVLSEQEDVLLRAEAEAEEMRQLAEQQAAFILDQSQLVRMAETRAQEVIESAEREAARLVNLAEQDARDLYRGLERELDLLVRDIKELVATRLAKPRD